MARDARRAAGNNDEAVLSAAIARVENHWHKVMADHFQREERLIQMAENVLDPESIARILSEHEELQRLASGPCGLEPAARLQRFADLASAHVRYEERVFFPKLQSHPRVGVADKQING